MECCENINGIPTPILTYGRGTDDELEDVNYLILLIPGNPGIIDFYSDFMSDMYDRLVQSFPDQMIPIWGICHAGHQCNHHKNRLPDHTENPFLYDLDGQVEHKIKFIQDCIPDHVRIIGIGHSIGCKVWSEMIRRSPDIEVNLLHCFMLFPTLERIQMTPNGQSILPYFPYEKIIPYLLSPLFYLPTFMKKFIIKYHLGGNDSDITPCAIPAAMHIFNIGFIQRSFLMTRSEFEKVVDLDVVTLKRVLHKLFFYFGTKDQWCPIEYALDMPIKLPQMKYQICELGLEHAFVLSGSSEMAGIVTNVVSEILKDM